MGDLDLQLFSASEAGDLPSVVACLAAGANPNSRPSHGPTPLWAACLSSQATVVAALLAGGALPDQPGISESSILPIHYAVSACAGECLAALLAGGADPCFRHAALPFNALHLAAMVEELPIVRQLLAAAPVAAVMAEDAFGFTPLERAVMHGTADVACCLLAHGPAIPAGRLLAAMDARAAVRGSAACLYADIAAHQPLSEDEWARVPAPCPGLGAALPAVLRRSAAEAALLVRRLPVEEQQRLRMAALCLARAQHQHQVSLPGPLVARVLALSAIG